KAKTALITGGNSGIGLAAARLFVTEGARVAITGRNQTTLDAASDELGPNALAFRADVAASKAGLRGMRRSMAGELAARGIRVNVAAPGFINTPNLGARPAPAGSGSSPSQETARRDTARSVGRGGRGRQGCKVA